ncbi:TerB family tellurite resistance protein [Thalassobaculum sp. OXR-137]|uniref:tellurite resistance TerB family protein n=1 Tax=Thalassobaculum sp. OXR-137 TaxID=3100173 RepID=UPI002AC9D811|nr:TerB family tellurite resistance protein [Thalassobaculum sp. OXR-137]WPZ34274.1 TerB family tellurite resistance protein [Thalassobaculum sp. OXR-137]
MNSIDAGGTPSAAPKDALATAVAVLLARAATLDGSFEAEERAVVAEHLCNRFNVSRDEIDRTLDEAATSADQMVDLYGLTRTVKDRLDEEGRIELMEALWEVVYADGELHDYESQLMRRLSGLLYITDRESGEARKRALAKLGLEVG